MARYVYRPGHPEANENGMVDADKVAYGYDGPGFHVISDTMDLTRHMADGKYYDSKSVFRQVTKAHGCEEVGNDPAISRPRKPIPLSKESRRESIARALYEVRNGRRSSQT